MFVVVTRMIASVGSLINGSGTLSTETLRRPCHVTARIKPPQVLSHACPLPVGSNIRRGTEKC